MNEAMDGKRKHKMNFKQRFSCAVGTVLNDVYRQLSMSFLITFLMKVAGVPPYQAGAALLIAQCTDAFVSPLNGYLGDKVKIPFLSNKMGRRKSWYFLGNIMMATALPFLFNQCLLCVEYRNTSWLPLAYFGFVLVVINVGYNLMEINHLAIISTTTDSVEEATAVNAFRIVFSFATGLYIYLIAWALLGQSSENDLGPDNLTQFKYLCWIGTGTGVIASIIFYIGTKEPSKKLPLRKISTLMDPVNVGGLLSASQSLYSMVFEKPDDKTGSASLAQTFIEMLTSGAKTEESLNDSRDEAKTETEAAQRKRSLIQRFVGSLFTTETNGSNCVDSAAEPKVVETKAESATLGPKDLVARVKTLDNERKKSLALRIIGGLVDMMLPSRPAETDSVTFQGDNNKDAEDEAWCSTLSHNGGDRSDLEERTEEDWESALQREPNDEVDGSISMKPRQRRKGVSLAVGDMTVLGIPNLGYQNEKVEVEVNEEPCTGSDSDSVENSSELKISTAKKTKNDWPRGPETSYERGETLNVTFATELSESTESLSQDEPVKTDTEVDSIDIVTCVPQTITPINKRTPMTIKNWLVNPHLYKVAVIVTCSRLVQDAVYAYLPLYLTERMGFAMQAIAYFPLVLLGSAALASIVAEKLNARIGSKWTYLLASLCVIGGSIYCFFQTPSLRQCTYAPVILIGGGMSIMYVMSLAFATELIGRDMETSGCAFSVIVIIARLSSGALFMTVQEFYPEDENTVSDFVRYAFTVVPGLLALTGFLLVMFFQPSLLCCNNKELISEEDAIQTKESDDSLDVVSIPG